MSLLERGFSGYAGEVTDWYAYVPVTGAAIAATVLFAGGLIAHTWQMLRHKAWIWIVMVLAVASTWIIDWTSKCYSQALIIRSPADDPS